MPRRAFALVRELDLIGAIAIFTLVLGAVQLGAGAMSTGVTIDEPFELDWMATWIEHGWYVSSEFLVDGRPDPDNQLANPYVYGPAFGALAHLVNVGVGNEGIPRHLPCERGLPCSPPRLRVLRPAGGRRCGCRGLLLEPFAQPRPVGGSWAPRRPRLDRAGLLQPQGHPGRVRLHAGDGGARARAGGDAWRRGRPAPKDRNRGDARRRGPLRGRDAVLAAGGHPAFPVRLRGTPAGSAASGWSQTRSRHGRRRRGRCRNRLGRDRRPLSQGGERAADRADEIAVGGQGLSVARLHPDRRTTPFGATPLVLPAGLDRGLLRCSWEGLRSLARWLGSGPWRCLVERRGDAPISASSWCSNRRSSCQLAPPSWGPRCTTG